MGASPEQPLPYSALLASFLLRIRKNVQCFQLYRGKEHGQLNSQPDARAPMGRACLIGLGDVSPKGDAHTDANLDLAQWLRAHRKPGGVIVVAGVARDTRTGTSVWVTDNPVFLVFASLLTGCVGLSEHEVMWSDSAEETSAREDQTLK